MLTDKVQVTNEGVISGRGLIAIEFIATGDVVWRPDVDAPLLSAEEVERQSNADDKYSQLEADLFARNEPAAWCWNHSCDPNTVLQNRCQVAACDIQTGEELTFDYGVTEIRWRWSFVCVCGSRNCRVLISNLDYLDSGLRRRRGEQIPDYAHRAAAAASFMRRVTYRCRVLWFHLKRRVRRCTPRWLARLVR